MRITLLAWIGALVLLLSGGPGVCGDSEVARLARIVESGTPTEKAEAVYMLGRIGTPEAVDVLVKTVVEADSRVSRRAVMRLVDLASPCAIRGLGTALETCGDDVARTILGTLEDQGTKASDFLGAVQTLAGHRTRNDDVRLHAVDTLEALTPRSDPRAAKTDDVLWRILADKTDHVDLRTGAARVLGRLAPRPAARAAKTDEVLWGILSDKTDQVGLRSVVTDVLVTLTPRPVTRAARTDALLWSVLADQKDQGPVRASCAKVLSRTTFGADRLPALESVLSEDVEELDRPAIGCMGAALGAIQPESLVSVVRLALSKKAASSWRFAVETVLDRGGLRILPVARMLLVDGPPECRARACLVIRGLGSAAAEAVPDLLDRVADGEPEVRLAALGALSGIGKKGGACPERILDALGDDAPPVRLGAMRCAAALEYRDPKLVARLAASVRETAALAIACFGAEARGAVVALERLSRDEDEMVREAAERAIRTIRGE